MKKDAFISGLREWFIPQILVLLILLFPGSIVLGHVIQNVGFIKAFDNAVYILINGKFPHTELIDKVVWPFDLWFIHWHNLTNMPAFFYPYLGLLLIYTAIKKRAEFWWAFLAVIIGAWLAGTLLTFDWHFIFRERPFVHLPNTTLNDATKNALKKWPSYPSGHTRDVTMFASIFAYFLPELTVLLVIFSVFIGLTRVYTGAHYPTDSISGLILGLLLGMLTIYLIKVIKKVVEIVKSKHNEKK